MNRACDNYDTLKRLRFSIKDKLWKCYNHIKQQLQQQQQRKMTKRSTVIVVVILTSVVGTILLLSFQYNTLLRSSRYYDQYKYHRRYDTTYNPLQLVQYYTRKNSKNYNQSIDIISIGSVTRPDHQDAQQNTFLQHYTIRNTYRINEYNDTDTTCAFNLTQQQLQLIYHFCTEQDNTTTNNNVPMAKVTKLLSRFKPILTVGWLCAQKRPIDGLYIALQQYIKGPDKTNAPQQQQQLQLQQQELPKYLILMDDDTYMNMTFMIDILTQQYPYYETHLLTGCLLNFHKYNVYHFPYGGYTSIYTQRAIQNMIQPIYCNNNFNINSNENNDNSRQVFNNMVCQRLEENLIGEKQYHSEGMSVVELMYEYSSNLLYTKIEEWRDGIGYCFHSDHALGYFLGYYYIGVPDTIWDISDVNQRNTVLHDMKYRGFSFNELSTDIYMCYFRRTDCGNISTTRCHYNYPQQMYDLYNKEV